MSETTIAAAPEAGASPPRSMRSMLLSMEIDTRLLGMIGATAVIWIGFNILSGGLVPHGSQPLEPLGPVERRSPSWPPAWS